MDKLNKILGFTPNNKSKDAIKKILNSYQLIVKMMCIY
ncbi:MAG: hypothetical protein CM15mP112_00060 [Flavobacteriales bacterium]|nr:MAG: hypothetical protein CM15mP112_00060 [Flavobacteriales bacterium]